MDEVEDAMIARIHASGESGPSNWAEGGDACAKGTKVTAFHEGFEVRELAGLDEAEKQKLPKDTTPVEVAAWTAVSRVLLNLDETITKE